MPLTAARREDARWRAMRARDATADGSFYYAVRTTGVYCRPSCAARPARPENVTFFKAATGVTPRAYAAARSAERVKRELESGESVKQAIYGSGVASPAREAKS